MWRITLAVIFVATCTTCQATLLFSENFEGATPGYDSTIGAIGGTGFSLVSGTIDIKGPGWYPLLGTGTASGNCVDTVGGGGGTSGQRIETTDSFSASIFALDIRPGELNYTPRRS